MPNDEFLADVEKAIMLYETINGHAATNTRLMIAGHREVEALSCLMISVDLQQGFKVLRDAGQLDKTFEELIVKYSELFKPDIVEAAEWRLEHPYDLLET